MIHFFAQPISLNKTKSSVVLLSDTFPSDPLTFFLSVQIHFQTDSITLLPEF